MVESLVFAALALSYWKHIFFAFPLILALIHSVFGIKFINIILATMGMSSMAASIGLTLAFVAVIYGGYFLITYLCSRSIIRPVR